MAGTMYSVSSVEITIPPTTAIPMAMGVVTDLGWSVAIKASSAPISRPIRITLTIPTMAPTNTEVRMEITNLRVSPKMIKQAGKAYVGEELAAEAEWLCLVGEA